jgi:anaerobic selenocysteine-containing dehydrogenase
MNRCRLSVQVSTKLNRSHLITGETALILPTFGRSEKDMAGDTLRYITVENSMGRVRRSRGLLKPASATLRSEPEIIAGLAEAYFRGDHPVNWRALGNDYNRIREKIDEVAKGFENTGERSAGDGYYLPNNAREGDFSKLPNGRAKITLNKLPEHRLQEDELLLMTIRSHDQFNTTIYGLNDRYRGIYNERRVVFMNRHDMQARGLEAEDVVQLSSRYNGKTREARNFKVIPYKIPIGNMAAYFPETNVLVPYNHFADRSGTPISKSIRVRVERVSRQ